MADLWPYPFPGSGNDIVTQTTVTVDPSIFREYDVRGTVRGVVDEGTVDDVVALRVGKAFGTLLAQRENTQPVVVGFDSREYSPRLATSLMTGLLSTGATVRNIGLCTSPMVYFAQATLGDVPGVSVTASHNPNGWAGFKLAFRPNHSMGPADMQHLKTLVDSADFVRGRGTYYEQAIVDDYVSYLASRLPAPRPMRVVIDGGNSISGPVAHLALSAAGYHVTAINEELDWSFPNHEPDPESLSARTQVSEAVMEHGAEVGLSFDGDGDRLGLTDESGGIVWPDVALGLLAEDVLARHPGASIVYDVKCSRAVRETVEALGGTPVMWMTGHSHIKAKLAEIGKAFGGERSGHYFDSLDYFGFDDALYAGLRVLDILARRDGSSSDAFAPFQRYVASPTMQAVCSDDVKYEVVERFAEAAGQFPGAEIIRINGVRAEFGDGWLLVRASSNLPALVMVVEAEDEPGMRRMYDLLRSGLDAISDVSRQWTNDPFVVEGDLNQ